MSKGIRALEQEIIGHPGRHIPHAWMVEAARMALGYQHGIHHN
jgi:hypothetical protein